MGVFNLYAAYYNLLYMDKDYAGEAEYIHRLIQKYQPGAKSILDLGCGTGRHDLLLAEKGYDVTGIDMSEEMLVAAHLQLSKLDCQPLALKFFQGDVRNIRLNKACDVVISLFHVMSYQTTNEDLHAAFASVGANLKQDGLFIFDCWYGPAVLTDRPALRTKQLENADIVVKRTAEPIMQPNENVVNVNYTVQVREKLSSTVEEIKESHRMRYLFKPEIEMMLKAERMTLLHCEEWMTGKDPGFDTWGVCFVARIERT